MSTCIKYVKLECECMFIKYVQLECECMHSVKYAQRECEYMYKVCKIRMWEHA